MAASGQTAVIVKLSGEYYVRALEERDLEGAYPSWFQDQEVCKYNSHGKFFKTSQFFRNFYQSLDGEDRVVWAMCHIKDGHIGNVSLQSLSFINRSAEFAVILGDRRHWGRGVAKLAGLALLTHGFGRLNLNRVSCGTAATNLGMQRLAVALKMREEGRRRDALYLDGKWVDVVEFGVLRDEFDGGAGH
jgi:ribosomal-protein-alanine N-acetyltransferase